LRFSDRLEAPSSPWLSKRAGKQEIAAWIVVSCSPPLQPQYMISAFDAPQLLGLAPPRLGRFEIGCGFSGVRRIPTTTAFAAGP
jgi:hypothetical protein